MCIECLYMVAIQADTCELLERPDDGFNASGNMQLYK